MRVLEAYLLCGLAAVAGVGACGREPDPPEPGVTGSKPNILFVVWDAVRADHLSLYGHERPTTPYLEQWAEGARVFEDCVSAANSTISGHGSMFTGLLPSEHGATYHAPRLAEELETLAELLKAAGYDTYCYSENPCISRVYRFGQGFDAVEHPWSAAYRDEAYRITRAKLRPDDRSSELLQKLQQPRVRSWSIKAAGELVQKAVETWLSSRTGDRPFFIFLNYMEAHRPLIPPTRYRQRLMTPEQVEASYGVDRTWLTTWSYAFGRHEYEQEEIELTRLTYDAALLELDALFQSLIQGLGQRGALQDTVVVLTSDHGEHLGEHHMLDHQFSVYEQLLRVPLVIHYPARFAAGRDPRPVSNIDLFPTLLRLGGVEPPARSTAIDLQAPLSRRPRLGECPAPLNEALRSVSKAFRDFDPRPWQRELIAYYDEPYKLIFASDGRHELYHLQDDPAESANLFDRQPALATRLTADLQARWASLRKVGPATQSEHVRIDAETRRRLQTLGYVGPEEDDSNAGEQAGEPGEKKSERP